MQKFLFKVLIFSALFAGANIAYLETCKQLDWNFAKRIEAINLDAPVFKNIILGNSLAMDGIDCKLLGTKPEETYNLALGGATVRTNLVQLQEYLRIAEQKPQRVILALGTYISDLEREDIHPLVEFTSQNHVFGLKDLPMLKFKWIAKELPKHLVSSNHRNAVVVQGQLQIKRKVADKSAIPADLSPYPIARCEKSIYVNQIAELCRENEIKLIILEMPGFRKTRNSSSIGPHVVKHNGAIIGKVFNFNGPEIDPVLDAKNDWLGNSHLNKFGAKTFTRYLKGHLPN